MNKIERVCFFVKNQIMRHRTRARALNVEAANHVPAILPCVVYAAQPHHPNQDFLDVERAEIGTVSPLLDAKDAPCFTDPRILNRSWE